MLPLTLPVMLDWKSGGCMATAALLHLLRFGLTAAAGYHSPLQPLLTAESRRRPDPRTRTCLLARSAAARSVDHLVLLDLVARSSYALPVHRCIRWYMYTYQHYI